MNEDQLKVVRVKLQALGIAAGVFAQTPEEARTLGDFRECVNDIFKAAGLEDVKWTQDKEGS